MQNNLLSKIRNYICAAKITSPNCKTHKKGEQWSPKYFATMYLILYECVSFLQPVYAGIDSYILSLVVNKVYGDTNTTMFMNPILCKIFATMHVMMPFSDVYSVLGEILMGLAVWLLIYFICMNTRNIYEKIGLCLIATLVLFWKEARIYDNFTNVASFLTTVGIVVLSIQMRKRTQKKIFMFLGATLIWSGMMWRQNAALLGIPFMLLDMICYWFQDTNASIRKIQKIFTVYGIAWIGMIILVGVNAWYIAQIPDAVTYNNARSALVDYHPVPYEQIKNPAYSRNDYNYILHMILGDTEYTTTKLLSEIAQSSQPVKPALLNLETLLYTVFGLRIYGSYWLVLYGFTSIILLIMHKKQRKYVGIRMALSYVGLFCISYGFVYIGRLTLSVLVAIYMYALLISSIIITSDYPCEGNWSVQHIKKEGLIIIIGLSMLLGYRWITMPKAVTLQSSLTANYHTKQELLKWENDDSIYFWDAYDFSVIFAEPFYQVGKLYPREALAKNIQLGEWTYHQPYFDEYLQRIGIKNPIKTLLQSSNAYFVGSEEIATIIQTYYKEHFHISVSKTKVEDFDDISIWSFEAKTLSISS